MRTLAIGKTELGQSIELFIDKNKSQKSILLVGGVHGNEQEGIDLIKYYLENKFLSAKPRSNEINSIYVIPCLNRDGNLLNLRSNINDVDLNRNLPSKNWKKEYENPKYKPGPSPSSEAETIAFMRAIEISTPDIIISCHSFTKSLILYNEAKGIYKSQIYRLAENLQIPIVDKMDYAVTGSLNSLSSDLNIETVTIECPRDNWNSQKSNYIKHFLDFMKEIESC